MRMVRKQLTPSAPQTAGELDCQIPLSLKQFGADFAYWDALDAYILGGWVLRWVVFFVEIGSPDRV